MPYASCYIHAYRAAIQRDIRLVVFDINTIPHRTTENMNVTDFLHGLRASRGWREQITHAEKIPAREGRFSEPDPPLPESIRNMLEQQDIHRLYTHQQQALAAVREGRDFVVVTGTASGKTLCYNLPVFEELLNDPQCCGLYLFPTKALSQDQLRGLVRAMEGVEELDVYVGTYDGDTPPDKRKNLRENGQIIFTNPDMLHAGILPNHAKWSRFFSRLKFVVIDEIHTYRGVFGSQVAGVLLRLDRICRHYGVRPRYLCSSATIANPLELAEQLTGRQMTLIDNDGAPRGPKTFALWNPPFLDDERIERRSPLTEAQYLMTAFLEERIPTIAFTRTRSSTELLYRFVQDGLTPSLARKVRAYRGGYLPQDRRQIEQQLFSGELLGVVSTNALELGIDIGSLEVCILVGYPGTVASTWQQAGRAGRGDEPALVIFIGQNSPIDQYLVNNGRYLFGRSPEHAIVDLTNPHIAIGHLRCAAKELPVGAAESENLFGEYTPAMLELLTEEKHLKKTTQGWRYAGASYPAGQVNLRNIDDVSYTINEMTDEGPQTIGMMDEMSAFTQAHTHAVYLHNGEVYFVDELDVARKVVQVKQQELDYYTQSITEPNIDLQDTERETRWRISTIGTGSVSVSLNVVMFKKIKFENRDAIGYENLDLPTRTLDTTAMWVVPPKSALELCAKWNRVPAEGLRGIVNVLVEVIPLFVMGDTRDIGGVVDSGNLGRPALFVYDKYPGGIGFSERAYEWMEQIMASALELIMACPCSGGCPSCVGAPLPPSAVGGPEEKDLVPDKEAALVLLHEILEKEPYTPREPVPPKHSRVSSVTESAEKPVKSLPPGVEDKIRRRIKGMGRR